MTDKESDPRPLASPQPEPGSVFLHVGPVKGGVFQEGKGGEGRGMSGLGGGLGKDIQSQARVCFPEERESIMKSSKSLSCLPWGSACGQLWKDQREEGSMLPFCRTCRALKGISLQALGPLVGVAKENPREGLMGSREVETNPGLGLGARGFGNIDWGSRGFGVEGPMGPKN